MAWDKRHVSSLTIQRCLQVFPYFFMFLLSTKAAQAQIDIAARLNQLQARVEALEQRSRISRVYQATWTDLRVNTQGTTAVGSLILPIRNEDRPSPGKTVMYFFEFYTFGISTAPPSHRGLYAMVVRINDEICGQETDSLYAGPGPTGSAGSITCIKVIHQGQEQIRAEAQVTFGWPGDTPTLRGRYTVVVID